MSVEVLLLGAAQDGGYPHCGCSCSHCVAARHDPRLPEHPASIAVISHEEKCFWIVDATPAFPEQLESVRRMTAGYTLSGIFVTHAHIGHYTGLMFLGREVMSTKELPVFASSAIGAFLKENAPWSQLVAQRNIVLNSLAEGQVVQLAPELSVSGVVVPHRNEFGDTFAFVVEGPIRSLFYCPDIDDWESWQHDLRLFLAEIDYALIDGTFFSEEELPEARMSTVPHPTVKSSCDQLAGMAEKITFIHMNHTNPLYRDGPERNKLLQLGFGVGKSGQKWELGNEGFGELV